MSKIALNSNASGSGVFTIESPNSDTDRTLNLPDKAGTVQVGSGIDDNATSTAITINSSEYVGIGIASPQEQLHVYTTGASRIEVESTTNIAGLKATNNQGSYAWYVDSSADKFHLYDFTDSANRLTLDGAGNVGIGTTSPVAGTKLTLNDNAFGGMQFQSGGSDCGYIGVNTNTLYIGGGDKIVFQTGNAQAVDGTGRMRIDSSGNLVVGSTSAAWGSTAKNVIRPGGDNYYIKPTGCASFNRTASDGEVLLFYRNGTYVGNVSITSSATSFNSVSDYRLKENVEDLTGATDRLKQLPVHQFNFTATPDITVDGFLAHEVSDIVPEAVTGTKDAMKTEEYEVTPEVLDEDNNVVTQAVMGTREVPDYQGIDQSKLVPLLTAALQEAVTRIETLEADVAALKAGDA